MSFRELRNFTEMMRALGYPRLISVENFRTPNFELVADCIYWMVKRYNPDLTISDVIDSEQDRVDFVTGIAQMMAVKARIKLNTKKLYAADGRAVRELLKIAEQLYKATRIEGNDQEEELDEAIPISTRLKDLKTTRAQASEITDRGAKLYDLLGNEPQLREARMKALRFLDTISSNLDSTSEHKYIEKSIREIIASVTEQAGSLEKQCTEMEADEKALDVKIKKKQLELERVEKRLKSLQTVRPSFMNEYEKLETELQRQYEVYLQRFRNLDYLEHELDLYNQSEREKLEESERSLKRMQDRLRKEELAMLRGEQDVDSRGGQRVESRPDGDRKRSDGDVRAQKRPSAANSRRGQSGNIDKPDRRSGSRNRMVGSLTGGGSDDSESEDLSEDVGSGSDLGDSDEEVSMAGSSDSGSGSGSDDLIEDDDDESNLSDDDDDGEGYNFGSGDSDNEF